MSAVIFFDMDGDRRIERSSRRSRVLLLRDLESYTGRLADAAAKARLCQPLERHHALQEASALVEGPMPVGAGSSRSVGMGFRSALAS